MLWDSRVGANGVCEAVLPFSAAANDANTHPALHNRFGNTSVGGDPSIPHSVLLTG